MISLPFTRTELELILAAIEAAGKSGWPTDQGDKVRVNGLVRQIERAIVDLRAEGWQGKK